MGEIRIKDLASSITKDNSYLIIDNGDDGCFKVPLVNLFSNGKLVIYNIGKAQLLVGNLNNTFENSLGIITGESLISSGRNRLVLGRCSAVNDNAVIIVGDGTYDDITRQPVRSNSLEFDKDGNLTIKGDLVHNSKSLSAEISQVEKSIMYDIRDYEVATTDWVLEGTPTYADYPYRAEIYLGSKLGDYFESDEEFIADIVPSAKMIEDGLVFSLITTDVDYTIYIYASDVPEENYTIPLISCRKVNEVE